MKKVKTSWLSCFGHEEDTQNLTHAQTIPGSTMKSWFIDHMFQKQLQKMKEWGEKSNLANMSTPTWCRLVFISCPLFNFSTNLSCLSEKIVIPEHLWVLPPVSKIVNHMLDWLLDSLRRKHWPKWDKKIKFFPLWNMYFLVSLKIMAKCSKLGNNIEHLNNMRHKGQTDKLSVIRFIFTCIKRCFYKQHLKK